ncbi:MAG TPA: hypothetical protein VGM19_01095 [Armatimonadota bacterium]|jgi:hypothetical protein
MKTRKRSPAILAALLMLAALAASAHAAAPPLVPGRYVTKFILKVADNTQPEGGLFLRPLGSDQEIWPQGKGRVAAFLGTPMGEAGPGRRGFWESSSWPQTMAALLRWLAGGPEG